MVTDRRSEEMKEVAQGALHRAGENLGVGLAAGGEKMI